MGKVKSRRQKLHTKAAKMKASEKKKDEDAVDNMSVIQGSTSGNQLFSKVNIDLDMLTRQLPGFDDKDCDNKSTITSKTLKGMNMKKKDKMKLKHEYWMKRIDGLQTAKKEAKDKKKRQQTAVIGDMKPLEDTLPTLELLLKDYKPQHQGKNESNKIKPIKKEKKRKKEMASDITLFHQVLQHPSFKENPTDTITQHLQNKYKLEEMDT